MHGECLRPAWCLALRVHVADSVEAYRMYAQWQSNECSIPTSDSAFSAVGLGADACSSTLSMSSPLIEYFVCARPETHSERQHHYKLRESRCAHAKQVAAAARGTGPDRQVRRRRSPTHKGQQSVCSLLHASTYLRYRAVQCFSPIEVRDLTDDRSSPPDPDVLVVTPSLDRLVRGQLQVEELSALMSSLPAYEEVQTIEGLEVQHSLSLMPIFANPYERALNCNIGPPRAGAHIKLQLKTLSARQKNQRNDTSMSRRLDLRDCQGLRVGG